VSEWPPGWDCHVHVFDAAAPARAGHYRPPHRPLAQIDAEALAQGVGHLVLVQPSVYGTDNRLLLDALGAEPGRHRGVVVLADEVRDAELDAMHEAGVRGARLNHVSPVGEAVDLAARFRQLAPRLHERGWHLQWYVAPEQLPELAALHRHIAPVCVIDHLAGLHAGVADNHPAWPALQALAGQGAWVKLSGWYRLGAAEPYDELLPLIRRVAAIFGDHVVWGSDWPHTSFAAAQMPRYASTWSPVVAALGAAQAAALRERPPTLYR
jgi:predicted TIM-barrel fold metal-dependent hydrolase